MNDSKLNFIMTEQQQKLMMPLSQTLVETSGRWTERTGHLCYKPQGLTSLALSWWEPGVCLYIPKDSLTVRDVRSLRRQVINSY